VLKIKITPIPCWMLVLRTLSPSRFCFFRGSC